MRAAEAATSARTRSVCFIDAPENNRRERRERSYFLWNPPRVLSNPVGSHCRLAAGRKNRLTRDAQITDGKKSLRALRLLSLYASDSQPIAKPADAGPADYRWKEISACSAVAFPLRVGDLRNQRAVNVGEAHVAPVEAVRQLRVIEAEQVQHRRMQIVVRDRLLDRLIAELVARADH